MTQGVDWFEFLGQAVKCGVAVSEFWAMTPREVSLVIVAHNERMEENRKRDLFVSWHVAAFSRSRRLPSLRQLLMPKEPVILTGKALEERQKERDEMLEKIDMTKINASRRKR